MEESFLIFIHCRQAISFSPKQFSKFCIQVSENLWFVLPNLYFIYCSS